MGAGPTGGRARPVPGRIEGFAHDAVRACVDGGRAAKVIMITRSRLARSLASLGPPLASQGSEGHRLQRAGQRKTQASARRAAKDTLNSERKAVALMACVCRGHGRRSTSGRQRDQWSMLQCDGRSAGKGCAAIADIGCWYVEEIDVNAVGGDAKLG
jgi:hypothetical protein